MKQLLWLLIVFIVPLQINAQWTYAGAPGISNSWSTTNDIETDTSGSPVIVFQDSPSSCMRFDGSQWQPVGASTYTFPVADVLQLLIDSNNRYYLFFLDYNTSYLSCITYNGSSWSYAGSQYIANEIINHFTAALDRNNVLHCAYKGSSGFNFKYFDGGSWQSLPASGTTQTMAFLSLAFDQNNKACVAYCDVNTLKANCRIYDNNTWSLLGTPDFSTGFARDLQLKITKANDVYVAYNEDHTSVKKLNRANGTWDGLGGPGLGFSANEMTDMITSDEGYVFLATGLYGNLRAHAFRYDGDWEKLGNSPVNDTVAGIKHLSLGRNGELYMVYNDFGIGKLVVKKYEGATSVKKAPGLSPVMLYPNPASDLLFIDLQKIPDASMVRIVNAAGEKMYEGSIRFEKDKFSFSIPLSGFSAGVYFLSVFSRDSIETGKFIVAHE